MYKVGDKVLFTDRGSGSPTMGGVRVPQPIPATVCVAPREYDGICIIKFDFGGTWACRLRELSYIDEFNDVVEIDE